MPYLSDIINHRPITQGFLDNYHVFRSFFPTFAVWKPSQSQNFLSHEQLADIISSHFICPVPNSLLKSVQLIRILLMRGGLHQQNIRLRTLPFKSKVKAQRGQGLYPAMEFIMLRLHNYTHYIFLFML